MRTSATDQTSCLILYRYQLEATEMDVGDAGKR